MSGLIKYWARSQPPLLSEKGFFSSKEEIGEWFKLLLKKTEEHDNQPVIFEEGDIDNCLHVIEISQSSLPTWAFLGQRFNYTNWKHS